MYLYNKQKNTHFLYHIFSDATKKLINDIIKIFMPEGFSHAIIVPGDSKYTTEHKFYLPKVISAIRESNPKVRLNVLHETSKMPEIVGYRGMLYEIPNHLWAKYHKLPLEPKGQASFKICDMRTYTTLLEIGKCQSIKELEKVQKKLNTFKYDKEIRKIFTILINGRKEIIKKINSFTTEEEVIHYTENLDRDLIYGNENIGLCNLDKAISDKIKELKILNE